MLLLISEKLRNKTDVRTNYWNAAGHGFQNGIRRPLAGRCADIYIDPIIKTRHFIVRDHAVQAI